MPRVKIYSGTTCRCMKYAAIWNSYIQFRSEPRRGAALLSRGRQAQRPGNNIQLIQFSRRRRELLSTNICREYKFHRPSFNLYYTACSSFGLGCASITCGHKIYNELSRSIHDYSKKGNFKEIQHFEINPNGIYSRMSSKPTNCLIRISSHFSTIIIIKTNWTLPSNPNLFLFLNLRRKIVNERTIESIWLDIYINARRFVTYI